MRNPPRENDFCLGEIRFCKPQVEGSIPSPLATLSRFSSVAERQFCKLRVLSSNLRTGFLNFLFAHLSALPTHIPLPGADGEGEALFVPSSPVLMFLS